MTIYNSLVTAAVGQEQPFMEIQFTHRIHIADGPLEKYVSQAPPIVAVLLYFFTVACCCISYKP